MSKVSQSVKPSPTSSKVFAASRDTGKSGIVYRLAQELTVAEAVIERQAGRDIVVCGSDLQSNQQMAREIEAAVGPYVRGVPHHSAGPAALPHFQPATRPPSGHSFYETPNRKARKALSNP